MRGLHELQKGTLPAPQSTDQPPSLTLSLSCCSFLRDTSVTLGCDAVFGLLHHLPHLCKEGFVHPEGWVGRGQLGGASSGRTPPLPLSLLVFAIWEGLF